jgi:hypothetical protein
MAALVGGMVYEVTCAMSMRVNSPNSMVCLNSMLYLVVEVICAKMSAKMSAKMRE